MADNAGPKEVPDPSEPSWQARHAAKFMFKPHGFDAITDPNAGKVNWLIDGLVPKGDAVMWAATWKTAKTMCAYRLALDAILGKPVWGRFKVEKPLKVAIFQLEMPDTEDDRRFRRLALGLGRDPAEIQALAHSGQLMHFNRPALDLTNATDIGAFHLFLAENRPDLVILDSIVAAFCNADLNDNAVVRRVLARAILPITSAGIAVILPHHLKKVSFFGQGSDKKSMVLGAGQFGAALSRTYSLERLDDDGEDDQAFTVKLSLLGAWSPGDGDSVILRVEDTQDGSGTTVEAIDAADAPKKANVKLVTLAAIAIQDIVMMRGRIGQKALVAVLNEDKGWSEKTILRGVDLAAYKGWVRVVTHPGSRHNEKDVIPDFDGNGNEESNAV